MHKIFTLWKDSHWLWFTAFAMTSMSVQAQSIIPATVGESLSGKRIVIADAMHGHTSILVMGFSKDGGMRCGDWVKMIHADSGLNGVVVYQASMLEGAPALIRPTIKSAMRKGMSMAEQDSFVVLIQDQNLWRTYFGVANDKEPFVVLMVAAGQVRWHGHGDAKYLEPLLKAALQ